MASNVLLGVIVAVFALWYNLSLKMDLHKVVYNHRPGTCRHVQGPVNGSEDIELIRSEGIAFVTSGLVYLQSERYVPGKIFLYDFNQNPGANKLEAKELKIRGDKFDEGNFHPHGLTHWIVNGVIRLYVVNHSQKIEHSIEVFDFNPHGPTLIHKKSIKDRALVRPNDIVAVGPDQFIFTNDGISQSFGMNSLEMLLGWKAGSVYYYDAQNFHVLLDGKGSPNGIAYDGKNEKLFVSMILDETIDVYNVSQDRLSVSLVSRINVHSGCDNLFIDMDGSVYSGCHPIMHQAAASFKNCDSFDVKAPSQVLRLRFDNEYMNAEISEVYANDGREITASSMATIYSNQLLIGSVCRNLIHCEIVDISVLE